MMHLIESHIDWFVLAIVIGFGFDLGGALYHVVVHKIHKE